MQDVAILTGDLIGSTVATAQATEAALTIIADTAQEIASWAPTAPAPRFTRFRGDGWQFAAPHNLGPRGTLLLAARLTAAQGLQSRISLGLGTVDDWGSAQDTLSAARGAALTASGRGLDAMTAGQILALTETGRPPQILARDQALIRLWAALARRWSAEQAEALALALPPDPPRQSAIATRLAISPQAVSLRLKGAEAGAILDSLAQWEIAQKSGDPR